MINNPLISIITISFNQDQFIEKTIESVLNQSYRNIEYIILDAGSTDNSREKILKYKNDINKIIFEKDNGPADGLNKGFKIAKGDIFCFLNSDDLLLENSLTKVVNFFKNNKNADVVYGNSWIINERGKRIRNFYSDKFNLKMAKYGASILAQQSTFFKKDAYLKTSGFNIKNRISWDGELFLDFALNNAKFYRLDEFLSAFRVHKTSYTAQDNNKKLHKEEIKKIYMKIENKKFNFLNEIKYLIYHMMRKIINPRDTFERIIKGSINKSYKN
tara:strand:+ start:1573 stop:2391 length:819 start_codon:yes stop_codon:yes gene_type:complete